MIKTKSWLNKHCRFAQTKHPFIYDHDSRKENDPEITTNPWKAYYFAIEERRAYREGEKAIASLAETAFLYAKNILQGSWRDYAPTYAELAEQSIAKEARWAYYYARNILGRPFHLGEAAILSSSFAAKYTRWIHDQRSWGEAGFTNGIQSPEINKYLNMSTSELLKAFSQGLPAELKNQNGAAVINVLFSKLNSHSNEDLVSTLFSLAPEVTESWLKNNMDKALLEGLLKFIKDADSARYFTKYISFETLNPSYASDYLYAIFSSPHPQIYYAALKPWLLSVIRSVNFSSVTQIISKYMPNETQEYKKHLIDTTTDLDTLLEYLDTRSWNAALDLTSEEVAEIYNNKIKPHVEKSFNKPYLVSRVCNLLEKNSLQNEAQELIKSFSQNASENLMIQLFLSESAKTCTAIKNILTIDLLTNSFLDILFKTGRSIEELFEVYFYPSPISKQQLTEIYTNYFENASASDAYSILGVLESSGSEIALSTFMKAQGENDQFMTPLQRGCMLFGANTLDFKYANQSFHNGWIGSSTNSNALAYTIGVNAVFGAETLSDLRTTEKQKKIIKNMPKNGLEGLKKHVNETYQNTQQTFTEDVKKDDVARTEFDEQGNGYIKLYRGVKSVTALPNAIESWTSSINVARRSDFSGCLILSALVPIKAILTTYVNEKNWGNQRDDEKEYVVIRKFLPNSQVHIEEAEGNCADIPEKKLDKYVQEKQRREFNPFAGLPPSPPPNWDKVQV